MGASCRCTVGGRAVDELSVRTHPHPVTLKTVTSGLKEKEHFHTNLTIGLFTCSVLVCSKECASCNICTYLYELQKLNNVLLVYDLNIH